MPSRICGPLWEAASFCRWRALDIALGRCAASSIENAAESPRAHCRCPHLSVGKQSKPTQALAKTPTLYHVNVIPTAPFLVVPEVSSERRDYIPIAWLEPPVIRATRSAYAQRLPLAVWTSHIYNAHGVGQEHRRAAQKRLFIRNRHYLQHLPPTSRPPRPPPTPPRPTPTPSSPPAPTIPTQPSRPLRPRPHARPTSAKHTKTLDRAVDRLYRRSPFTSDRERVEHLLTVRKNAGAADGQGQAEAATEKIVESRNRVTHR